ncbi:probable tubulin polyglutamylase TTLL2 isoform X2 [Pseudomyrmex gracilis]|nr:probable tubulin polyglutamylase TTLL2 isoform X2 [Pseudomyrmex gracilis]
MKKIHGSIYDFSPVGYTLPSEYTRLAEECSRCEKDEKVWICKPVGQSQGKGIFLFRKLSDLSYDNAAIVQRYIENPLLIGGYKFDLRLYVCVPSYRPLTIYLYKEGLTRFATEKFSLERLDDPFQHLTNFSLNKLGPGYSEKKERIGAGCKWTFRQLRRYLERSGYFDWILWQRISCLVTLTILSQAAAIPRSSNCFEFFGFDVLIDENLKPWLLEVNLSPALSNDCEIDSEVKKPLLHDLFDLLGLPVCNTGLSLFKIWSSSDRIEEDENEISSKYNRFAKRNLKREANAVLNLSAETQATVRQSTELCPTHTVWSRYNSLLVDKCIHREYKRNVIENFTSPIWDNGRDWRTSCAKEGGWIRICPFTRKKNIKHTEYAEPSFKIVENEIKDMVLSIQKYLKAAKEVHQRNEKLKDEQYNALLQSTLKMNTEVWLPEK